MCDSRRTLSPSRGAGSSSPAAGRRQPSWGTSPASWYLASMSSVTTDGSHSPADMASTAAEGQREWRPPRAELENRQSGRSAKREEGEAKGSKEEQGEACGEAMSGSAPN